jgi:hypothetical protein
LLGILFAPEYEGVVFIENGVTSQKMEPFIFTAVGTSKLTLSGEMSFLSP